MYPVSPCFLLIVTIARKPIRYAPHSPVIEYTEVRNFAQGEEEWARHRDSATMDVA